MLRNLFQKINNETTDSKGKTVYLHIGPHKTGTSSIQIGLALNQDLLMRNGILCPQTGRLSRNSAGNHNLAREYWPEPHPYFDPGLGLWKDLVQELRSSEWEKAIITSEGFCFLEKDEISKIKENLKGYDVKIIIYVRRQDAALQSNWVSHVRNSATRPFIKSFWDWLVANEFNFRSIEYQRIISDWEAVFSKSNLYIKLFEPENIAGSFFEDFLSTCGISMVGNDEPPLANPSPGVKTIEAMRLIKNTINFEDLPGARWQLIATIINDFGEQNHWNDRKVNYLSPELSEKILKIHAQANKTIAQRYFGREVLFQEKLSHKGYTDTFTYDAFTKDEILRLLIYFSEELGRYK